MSFNTGPHHSTAGMQDLIPAFLTTDGDGTLAAHEQQLAQREEDAEDRDWELDYREEAIDDAEAEVLARESEVEAGEQRLVQYISDWTGQQPAAGQTIRNFLSSFNLTNMPFPAGLVEDATHVPSVGNDLEDQEGMGADWEDPEVDLEGFMSEDMAQFDDFNDDIFALPHQSIEPFEQPQEPVKSASAAGCLAIPNMASKLRSQPSKRKRSPENGDSDIEKTGGVTTKKVKVVIDLTHDD